MLEHSQRHKGRDRCSRWRGRWLQRSRGEEITRASEEDIADDATEIAPEIAEDATDQKDAGWQGGDDQPVFISLSDDPGGDDAVALDRAAAFGAILAHWPWQCLVDPVTADNSYLPVVIH